MALVVLSCGAYALVSASCDMDSTINGCHCIPLGQDDYNKVHIPFGDVTPLAQALSPHKADSILNGITAILRSRQFKEGAKGLQLLLSMQ